MYINGFTRESVMEQIRARNLGYPSNCGDEDGTQCLYRAPNGNQCLVGCFIPDNLYKQEFEGKPVKAIYDKMPEVMPLPKHYLIKFQDFHDKYILRDETPEMFFKDIENKLIELEKEWEDRWSI